ncbi:MAG TPA: hypothetical protein VMR66_09335 [Gemmatimonadota bacterium]|nr:hypothetical protein [Gemmatimonadota bacterium]
MAHDRNRDIPWGGFLLIAALATIGASIFFLREIERAFRGSYIVLAAFPEGGSVRPGAPVWVAGRESGEVVRVVMLRPTAEATGGIVVEVEFPRALRQILRSGSRVRMTAGSPTAGDIVEFFPGAGTELTPVDTIWGSEPVNRAEHVVAGLGVLARDMRALFDTVQAVADAGEIRVERLDELGEQVVAINEMLEEFADAVGRSSARRGDILADLDRLGAGIARLGALLGDARAALRGPESRRAEARAVRQSLPATIAELSGRLAGLQAALDDPNGSLSRLQSDSALWRAVGAARAEADSLIAELAANPARMF